MQGFRAPAADAQEENDAVSMATRWKQKMNDYRSQQRANAPTDELGLKRVTNSSLAPHLRHLIDSN